MKPRRIQRKRTKGWTMPKGAVYVGRPTPWGNPFTVEDYWKAGHSGGAVVAQAWVVTMYWQWIRGDAHVDGRATRPRVRELRGKDLACWCPLDQSCHADVLLELANAPVLGGEQEQEP